MGLHGADADRALYQNWRHAVPAMVADTTCIDLANASYEISAIYFQPSGLTLDLLCSHPGCYDTFQ
jgi:hypothetical protein